jgi:SAM-dependent methyltransferase
MCRSCGADAVETVLSLGRLPLANALLTASDLEGPEPVFPLDLAFCHVCSLVQILETVPPERLFRDYLYFSSYSETMVEHARRLANELVQSRNLNSTSCVLEVASNDGYLLRHYVEAGVPVLGVEPAANVAALARQRGIPTISEFFGADLATSLAETHGRADVLHAHNVLAHVADLNGFVRGLRIMMKGDGVAIIEVPYVREMVDQVEFDTIYHEHLCYFSLTALAALFERHGLRIVDVTVVPIHGGSLRVLVQPSSELSPSESVATLLTEEQGWGVSMLGPYKSFADQVAALRAALRELLLGLKGDGNRIAAYGAAAKGTTLLNYCGVGGDIVDFVVDRSTHKQGRFVPGVRIPIDAPARLLKEQPDYVLLLTWNLASEILEQQNEYLARGGKFIVPLPEPHVL